MAYQLSHISYGTLVTAQLLDALGYEQCVLVGHDWGAILAWQLALLAPARFVALCAMSVPPMHGAPVSPMATWAGRAPPFF